MNDYASVSLYENHRQYDAMSDQSNLGESDDESDEITNEPHNYVVCNKVHNTGDKYENIWSQMNVSSKRWQIRVFSQFSSHHWEIGITDEGLVKYSSGKKEVFCNFNDIGQIRIGEKYQGAICISILRRYNWHDDKSKEVRCRFAMCCGMARKEIVLNLLRCMHQKGILPETRTVRETRESIKSLRDKKELDINFDHRRRLSKRYGEYGSVF